MSRYLDASVLIPMLVEEPSSPVVDAYLPRLERSPIVSDFAAAEVASAMSRLVRTGLLSAQDAQSALADFDAWRAGGAASIDILPADIRLAAVFVRRFELMLRAPDALHLAVSARAGLTLATLDRRLAAAAAVLDIACEIP